MPRGIFLTFEGLDGCGKTTQLRLLAARLRGLGHEVLETAEPGGTAIGQQVRQILLDAKNESLSPTAELLLYFACRAQNVDESIRPALERGAIVLSDRFTDSTLAYQGAGRGLGEQLVDTLDGVACRGLAPDRTLYLDIPLEQGLARVRARNEAKGRADRMDQQTIEFFQRVQQEYRDIVQAEPLRVRLVDARGTIEEVAARVWNSVAPLLAERQT